MALPASQLAGRIPDSYIHMWAASLLRGRYINHYIHDQVVYNLVQFASYLVELQLCVAVILIIHKVPVKAPVGGRSLWFQ